MELNPLFGEALASMLGTRESHELLSALEWPSPISVRYNPYKIESRPEGDAVPWCRYGFYLPERPNFTLDAAFHGGAYYVQEASSMFVEQIMCEAFGREGCEGLRVLDLCASPGGKSTLLSTLVGMGGVVVANEAVRQRTGALIDNAVKWGLGNIVVTHNDPAAFCGARHQFDVMLVDAPCSGEGMMRKSEAARQEWSPDNVKLCAARQRRIVADAWDALKPGGLLIYSTCTFNDQENEQNVAWMARELECTGLKIYPGEGNGVVCGHVPSSGEPIATFRFFPHKVRGEGFFVAAMLKPEGRIQARSEGGRSVQITDADTRSAVALGQWLTSPEAMRFAVVGDTFYGYYAPNYRFTVALARQLNAIHSGVEMGQLFHGKLRPAHSLAMFVGLDRNAVGCADIDPVTALAYLRKQDIPAGNLSEGLNLICCDSLPLGWAKRIGQRVNNMYPTAIRILA